MRGGVKNVIMFIIRLENHQIKSNRSKVNCVKISQKHAFSKAQR